MVLVLLSTCLPRLHAEEQKADTIDTERDDFVTASLVIGSPLPAIWSVFGHATLHMQCPPHGLDFMFTFESDTNVGAFMTGVAGKAKAKYVAVPAQEYIADARREGRELREYRLNLTLNERKELWRRLDEEMMAGAYRHFNLLYTNCVTNTVGTVTQVLQGEHIEWGPTPYILTRCDGDFFRDAARNSPWSEFMFITFIGTAYDQHSPLTTKLSPENVPNRSHSYSTSPSATPRWTTKLPSSAPPPNLKNGARPSSRSGKPSTIRKTMSHRDK